MAAPDTRRSTNGGEFRVWEPCDDDLCSAWKEHWGTCPHAARPHRLVLPLRLCYVSSHLDNETDTKSNRYSKGKHHRLRTIDEQCTARDSPSTHRQRLHLLSLRNLSVYSNQLGAFGLDPVHSPSPRSTRPNGQGESRHLLVRWLAKAAVILANGYVLFFFSERVFWSFPRPNDSLADLLLTWLVYSLLGWILLILVRRYRIASFLPLFLAGAVYGWIAEGVVVDTLYGGPGNPFPLSVSFTGLSWHALLSVGVGWYLLPKALTAPEANQDDSDLVGDWPLLGTVGSVVAIRVGATETRRRCRVSPAMPWHARFSSSDHGVFWEEHDPIGSRPDDWRPASCLGWWPSSFFAHGFPARAVGRIDPAAASSTRGDWAPTQRRQRGSTRTCSMIFWAEFGSPMCFALVLIPLTAIATYAPFRLLGLYPATNIVLYLVTMPLGFWFFFQALWRTALVRRRGYAPTHLSESLTAFRHRRPACVCRFADASPVTREWSGSLGVPPRRDFPAQASCGRPVLHRTVDARYPAASGRRMWAGLLRGADL